MKLLRMLFIIRTNDLNFIFFLFDFHQIGKLPYKGKGVRYKDEHVRRKEGKTAGKK